MTKILPRNLAKVRLWVPATENPHCQEIRETPSTITSRAAPPPPHSYKLSQENDNSRKTYFSAPSSLLAHDIPLHNAPSHSRRAFHGEGCPISDGSLERFGFLGNLFPVTLL